MLGTAVIASAPQLPLWQQAIDTLLDPAQVKLHKESENPVELTGYVRSCLLDHELKQVSTVVIVWMQASPIYKCRFERSRIYL